MDSATIIANYLTTNGFEDMKRYDSYMINRKGEVWSKVYQKVMKPQVKNDYLSLNLTKDGISHKESIQSLLDIQYNENSDKETIKPDPETIANYLTTNGFEDMKRYDSYMINRKGEIWSKVYQKVIKPQVKEDLYLCMSLTQDGIRHKESIHRLLGIQYIDNPDNLPEIDHIDRNRTNNSLENLRWVDKKTQMNNKTNNIALKTEEEQVQRIKDITEYKRVWAEKNRRENGVEPRSRMTDEEQAVRSRELRIGRQAEMTDEERAELNKKRRENRPEQTEEQKNAAKERARKQRENRNADQLIKNREYQKKKAQENRDKMTDEERVIFNEKSRIRMKEKYDHMTAEEKAEFNEKRKATYASK